ncbi:TetR-like C-terminal domain-containing protein [Kitasatospora sp. NPDC094028]
MTSRSSSGRRSKAVKAASRSAPADRAVAERPGEGDQALDHLGAAVRRHRQVVGLAGAGQVERQQPHREGERQLLPDAVQVGLPGVQPAAGQQDRGVGGQAGGRDQVDGEGGRAAPVRDGDRAALELHREAGGGEDVLLDLAGQRGALRAVRERGELTASDEGIPVPDTGTVRTDLAAFARALADYLATPLGRAVVRGAVLGADDPALAESWQAFWQSRLDQAGVIVRRAVERGELPADTDTSLALELLCAPLQARAVLGHRAIEPDLPDRLAHLVLDGLRGRA